MGLDINNLFGGYAGHNILKNISFKVPDGKIVALIGLNGAGKSTTINHVIGELQPQMGTIALNGVDLIKTPTEFKKQIAYIPEQPILYDELTLSEHLHLMLSAYELDDEQHWQLVEKLLTKFRLEKKQHWLPTHFSKGMKQKVMLVAAFMLERPLLIIDEPFLGLDTLAIKAVIDLMQEQARKGNSILLTTHLLKEATQFVDEFVVLYDGRIRFTGSPHHLAAASQLSVDNLEQFFESIQEELDDER